MNNFASLPPDQSTEGSLGHSPSTGAPLGAQLLLRRSLTESVGRVLLRVGPLAVCIRVIMLACTINCHEMVQTVDVRVIWAEAMTAGQNYNGPHLVRGLCFLFIFFFFWMELF